MPYSSAPRGLVTPIEPASARVARASVALPPVARETSYSIAFGRIDAAVASSCGSLHHRNEDAHSPAGHPALLFVVADGVGGGAMAETASRELVSHLHAALDGARPDAAGVRRAMLGADRAIASRIAQVTSSPGAATVVLCAPVNVLASKWLIAWVGDCRAYRLASRGELRFDLLTRDDTFRELNEAPPPGGSLDDPARMVGNGATTGANVAVRGLRSGELLALCSDGVHKHVSPAEWRRVLAQPVPLARRCDDLIALASANGSTDDATVLLVQRTGFATARPQWLPARTPDGGGPGSGR
ncbi:MAG: serine/threonine-protein phosphatase [Burkholderiales bacterium]|nr:serine/threonine-protein phosphatase [Burkholderiales bacterium]